MPAAPLRASWPDLVALSIAVGAFVHFGARYLPMLTESARAHPSTEGPQGFQGFPRFMSIAERGILLQHW